MFRTAPGIGTVTATSCRVGPEALLPNIGVDLPEPRVLRFGLDAEADDDAPGKVEDRINRTSKSAPVGPKDFDTSIETGSCRLVLDQDLMSKLEGIRFTS